LLVLLLRLLLVILLLRLLLVILLLRLLLRLLAVLLCYLRLVLLRCRNPLPLGSRVCSLISSGRSHFLQGWSLTR
ncbi:hypothetical protein Tsubulata_018763, partial [Turnera subulata]